MFQHAIGEDTFTQGVKYYLQEMSFKAATDKDLVQNLQRAINESSEETKLQIQPILDSWTLQPGYPVLMVNTNEDLSLTIWQKKFGAQSEASTDFHIPVTYATAYDPDFKSTVPKLWLNQTNDLLILPELEDGWIIVNIQATGYYRVNYDGHLWQRITDKLQSNSFDDVHKHNRALLVSDAFAVANANMHWYKVPLGLIAYLRQEREFVAWKAADDGLRTLHRQLSDSSVISSLNRFIHDLTESIYGETEDRLKLQETAPRILTQVKLDTIVIDWACTSGNRNCLQRASDLVMTELNLSGSGNIEPYEVLYCNAVRVGNSTLFKRIWNLLESTEPRLEDVQRRDQLINALGCSSNSNDLMEYLNSTLLSKPHRPGEQNKILYSVFRNGGPLGVELSIDFITLNHRQMEENFPQPTPVLFAVNYMVEYVTSDRLNQKFASMLDELVIAGILDETLKTVFSSVTEANVKWFIDHEQEFVEFFEVYFRGGATSTLMQSTVLFMSTIILLQFFF